MAKGDDAVRRKRSRIERKKMRKESTVSARVASIIAAKSRRKAGKRRMCQGMCFSLPTPEDPFNEKNDKAQNSKNCKKPKKLAPRKVDPKNEQSKLLTSLSNKGQTIPEGAGKLNHRLFGNGAVINANERVDGSNTGNTDCLSKFLILCLNAIQNAWVHDGTFDASVDRPLLANTWGVELWKCCSVGSDILETSGTCTSIEQIAWLVSTASDVFSRKEKEGQFVATPFLLLLVPSQEKAIKVRSVCKPLKDLGIHTVSLHPGASVGHQIHGLRSCEPEFLVSTPERLFELVSLKAIDISGVSLLVLDGLESFVSGGFVDALKSLRQFISGSPQTIIFSDSYGNMSTSVVQNLFEGPIRRLSLNDSIASQSACISQFIHVYISEEEKISKAYVLTWRQRGEITYRAVSRALFQLREILNIIKWISKGKEYPWWPTYFI
ncbi:P-loop containing nucleoside triphosphate hydrolases superfamily protein isoform X2 [Tasmannia lanceolata]|uniref:P-loop containing nucleoside triphosphate hydrolases superfamily protein isoform X2 n=1 Tax=Tasmannia lanceolata TaxID=3420 RepID=UPI004062B979